ncbi:MAG: glycosyltransferase family 2 protein [Candidatus Omnitrophica bacterium]|nr:glycosyltransferase family 2 protein [Candidatus Omnitrophota bacterium]MDD5352454.1 glycosyltransferase family 2 protein [Candidatus Omnitrophota bacterium]MDD5550052.1 glycosyltransferase family 2 protein [Candidatus Omnitrophota bacterium]
MKISIVIPTYNRRDNLARLLESLKKQTYKNFEVVIVDACSTDGTDMLPDEFKDSLAIKYIVQKGKGFTDAVNTGIQVSSGEIFLRADDDITVTPDWLNAVNATFESSPKIGGVTGPVITPEEYLKNRDVFIFHEKFKKGNIFWKLLGKIYFDYFLEGQAFSVCKDFRSGAFSFGANFPDALKIDKIIEVDHHESCNMAVRMDLLLKIGGFDDSYIVTSEFSDSDVAYKLRRLGFITVFNPMAIISHFPSKQGFFSKRFNSYHRIENFIRFYFRYIKPNTLDKATRFILYLGFQNCYFFYIFLTTGKIEALGSIPSTIINLFKYSLRSIFKKEE